MSLKGIELQIAIPKTFEAGKVAEQKQQQSQLSQDNASLLTERQALKNKETVLESQEYAKMDADGKSNEQNEQTHDEKETKEEGKKSRHPYKGSFVDFSG